MNCMSQTIPQWCNGNCRPCCAWGCALRSEFKNALNVTRGKRDSLLSIKEPHTLICQPAQICDESRRRFSLPDSNETQSSGTGVADRTRIAEGHAQFVRLWAAKHANDRPRHVRHHIQLRSGNDCRGAGRSRSLPMPRRHAALAKMLGISG